MVSAVEWFMEIYALCGCRFYIPPCIAMEAYALCWRNSEQRLYYEIYALCGCKVYTCPP